MEPFEKTLCRHYLRFTVRDKPGVLARIAGILGRHGVSIASVHQDDAAKGSVPIVVVTHRAAEGAVSGAIKEADSLPAAVKKAAHIRMEDFR